ncbi:hypothetical protein DFJ67_6153 [Asanoa ferruginea]|uniref:Uncharacterized protein n=1 Tax=Asanoa ferruginea TaxID=53367 RepID=A0A3D9ZRU7_9ACTN|nr:hypothetical protein [Asanoa ferruginea]REG00107.1 hypothetical protein DFJ67_6153 [Asanoa ferruginea]GIF46201.1 hypothetical protein Afe04nite_07400 [Asanoa ferruginea]
MGTFFAALYGDLTPHPWRDPEFDAYFLFYHRSVAMGWLGDGALWGMNDAGEQHPLGASEPPLAAWFQVGVEPLPAGNPLPVQAFLRCAADATAGIGRLRLRAAQVVLPVEALDPGSRPPPALIAAGWFAATDPSSRTRVRVTLDGGEVAAVAARLCDEINSYDQRVYACDAYTLTDHGLSIVPPFEFLGTRRVTFDGTLAEWSPDAIGWLGAFLGDLCARQGVATPVLLTAVPA